MLAILCLSLYLKTWKVSVGIEWDESVLLGKWDESVLLGKWDESV